MAKEKYKMLSRNWVKENGQYIKGEDIFNKEVIQEYSLCLFDEDNQEIYEEDILRDNMDEFIIRYKEGAWQKIYKDGKMDTINIFDKVTGKIIDNRIKRG